ncbi:MAG: uroporphyrinogen decarboxylase [Candidatus Hydrogenedentota bacterium]|nr:MAG: uroporphyrinogen decarboxylase [Candidatus Hydrogenedentota bacterium]
MTLMEKALSYQKVKRPPIWFMRQAGRYLPEYQKVKGKLNFWEMATNPDIAAEITLQPVKRFGLDAAIIFADIMTLLYGLGMNISFETGTPVVSPVITKFDQIHALRENLKAGMIEEKLTFFYETLQKVRNALPQNVSLLGFCASPYTLASYMLEGKTSRSHNKVRALALSNSDLYTEICKLLVDASVRYLKFQQQAGITAAQLFESWGDSLGAQEFAKVARPYVANIVEQIPFPLIYFDRGASLHQKELLPLYDKGLTMLSIDWRIPIDFFQEKPVQGNLDPAYLLTDPKTVQKATFSILQKRSHLPGFIFNLGHGISPDAKLDCVYAMVETVKNYSSTGTKHSIS